MNFLNRTCLYLFCIICFLLGHSVSSIAADSKPKPKAKKYKVPNYSKSVVKSRMADLDMSIDLPINKDVKNLISSYTVRARPKTEKMLGRAHIYFPIFEKYLKKYNLPQELKCLAVIESGLKPKAISHVGAAGLWQFMPNTGKQYGLKINDYVDERMDVHKSTEAAMKHLSKQYDRFGDWTLAIAAYNCGSGRMKSAIKKAKSKDYRKLKKYLPKETQHYITKFVAANYVVNYYLFYDMHPKFLDYTFSVTETQVFYDYVSFKEVAKNTGISREVLAILNPSYKTGSVPPNPDGNFIIVPIIGRN